MWEQKEVLRKKSWRLACLCVLPLENCWKDLVQKALYRKKNMPFPFTCNSQNLIQYPSCITSWSIFILKTLGKKHLFQHENFLGKLIYFSQNRFKSNNIFGFRFCYFFFTNKISLKKCLCYMSGECMRR